MHMTDHAAQNILIWLPSPLGDAIMSTPALSAFRSYYTGARIVFLAQTTVRAFLDPCPYCDAWIEKSGSFWQLSRRLGREKFDTVILLKNSFSSALTVFMAGIGRRIGYARDMRNLLLTDTLLPEKQYGRFKPVSAVDYYLAIARFVGAEIGSRKLTLGLRQEDRTQLYQTFPQLRSRTNPLAILVPGGAFGPSKLWPVERFAGLADQLHNQYQATVVISVAPTHQEKHIAAQIQAAARYPLLSLSDHPLKAGPLKALFEKADLVITNDTGPRHIAIALGRKVITLFGPNNPAWTQTGYADEIQIIGQAPCAPCDKPKCINDEHYCMKSISIEMVLEQVRNILGSAGK
jgi:heptosyltransferase-2